MIRQLSLRAALAALPSAVLAQPDVSERGLDGFVQVDRLPVPEHPVLARGREIWGETCQNCHGGNKLVGAPKITSIRAWAPRIDWGMDMLTARAIEGFIGPAYAHMPARGGNDALGTRISAPPSLSWSGPTAGIGSPPPMPTHTGKWTSNWRIP